VYDNNPPSGVGLPSSSATLPTSALSYNLATLQTGGLPSNMCILAGLPEVPNRLATTLAFPFGIWFANATTVYVADEGDGYAGGTDLYTHAAAQTTAGLQKWVFNSSTNSWNLVYTLQNRLNLGVPYTIRDYPTGTNAATGLPWAPATDGLRNLTGLVGEDGYVNIWAITSTISGNGDQGADPINSSRCPTPFRTRTPPSRLMKDSSPFAKLASEKSCATFLSRPEPTSISLVVSRYGSSTLPDRLDRRERAIRAGASAPAFSGLQAAAAWRRTKGIRSGEYGIALN